MRYIYPREAERRRGRAVRHYETREDRTVLTARVRQSVNFSGIRSSETWQENDCASSVAGFVIFATRGAILDSRVCASVENVPITV